MTYENTIGAAPVVLVEFYATWCPHCRHMMPVVEQVKQQLGDSVPVYQFDIDKDKEAATTAEVETIPTFIIYKDGREEWRHSGEIDENALLAKIKSLFNNL